MKKKRAKVQFSGLKIIYKIAFRYKNMEISCLFAVLFLLFIII
ncbi:MAG: hypothetical protein RL757_64 [Bacteroidota bacterium]|jgi:hypothetical protein